MAARPKLEKGFRLEEVLRAYFLRAGFFAVRSIPFQHEGDDLTDIDVWLYERPTGSSRRRQIVDAKSKTKPKAVERLLWTKGLVQLLDVDGAYVATTDARPMLRDISKKLGISVLDGADIKRISESDKVMYPDRIWEEELHIEINSVDEIRRNKVFQKNYHDLKHSLIDNFGAGTINRAIEAFFHFSSAVVTAHPNSDVARTALRLSYFSAAIVALSLDYVNSEVSFRAAEERRAALVNAVRYGNTDENVGLERIRLAIGLLQRYIPNGDGSARTVEMAVRDEFRNIPAEIIGDYVVKNTKSDDLFQIARKLEQYTFSHKLTSFDALGYEEKSFVAMLLDHIAMSRSGFASGWGMESPGQAEDKIVPLKSDAGPLFTDKAKTTS